MFRASRRTGGKLPASTIVKWVFFANGLPMLLVALGMGLHTAFFLSSAERAAGQVVALEHSESDEGGDLWSPRVRFSTPSGQAVEFVHGFYSNPPGFAVGEAVAVHFDPARPQNAKLGGFFSLWGLAIVFGGIGGAFTAVALWLHFAARPRRRTGRYAP